MNVKQALNAVKEYPKSITLKGWIVGGVIVAVVIVMAITLRNMHVSTQKMKEAPQQKNPKELAVNNQANTAWYKDKKVRQPNTAQPAAVEKTAEVAKVEGVTTVTPTQPPASENAPVKQSNQPTPEEMKKILSASISSNQISDNASVSSNPINVTGAARSSAGNEDAQKQADDQNMQGEKKAFLKSNAHAEDDYLHEGLKNPLSPYEVKAGTIVPATLITGVNSELPGQITAQVRSNVYDTVSGKYLLIPQGAKLTGLYDSQVAYGQSRVLVVWKRIIYPNGQSISLEGMPGVDMSGYAGFNDQVNNHYMRIFGSVIMMSIVSAGAQLSQPQNDSNSNNNNPSVNQTLAASLGTNIMNSANAMLQKNLGMSPTLVIRPGYLMNVSITKDMVFPGAYKEGTSYEN